MAADTEDGEYIAATEVSPYGAMLQVQSSDLSCGVAEASKVPFSLAMLAESPLPCSKSIILYSSGGGPKTPV